MDWANKGCLEFAGLVLDLEGHRCTFRQVVEPDVAYIAASKRVGLPVFSKERSGASVALELRNGARHTLMADLFQEMPKGLPPDKAMTHRFLLADPSAAGLRVSGRSYPSRRFLHKGDSCQTHRECFSLKS
jgi:hypothetical protein